jgi:hypothetical protein
MNIVDDLLKTLDEMVNDQFESLEFKNFFAVPLTLERARISSCLRDQVTRSSGSKARIAIKNASSGGV